MTNPDGAIAKALTNPTHVSNMVANSGQPHPGGLYYFPQSHDLLKTMCMSLKFDKHGLPRLCARFYASHLMREGSIAMVQIRYKEHNDTKVRTCDASLIHRSTVSLWTHFGGTQNTGTYWTMAMCAECRALLGW